MKQWIRRMVDSSVLNYHAPATRREALQMATVAVVYAAAILWMAK